MTQGEDTLPKRFLSTARKYPENTAILSKDPDGVFQPITYNAVKGMIESLAMAFSRLGIKRGDHIGLISDNRKEWYMADMAILSLGAADVPRGSDTTLSEIEYILDHADCEICIAENNQQARKILEQKAKLSKLKKLIIFEDDGSPLDENISKGIEIHMFQDLLEKGEELKKGSPSFFEDEIKKGKADDLVTLIYTSGTTGEPKGVMLTNRNYTFQLDRIYDYVDIQRAEIFLTVLPIWHSFERVIHYIVIYFGATLAYSKLVGKIMLEDFKKVKPHWMTSVPRIWEMVRNSTYKKINDEKGAKKAVAKFLLGTAQLHVSFSNMISGRLPQFSRRSKVADFLVGIIPFLLLGPLKGLGNILVFNKIKESLGGRFNAGISGGGALPPYVDKFFQAAGILLLEGYGLTETAPVLAVRKRHKPVGGTVGTVLPDIEFKIINKTGQEVGPGEKGVLFVKSEQIMQGYYKNPDATEAVLQEGWLNTGDICMATFNREIKIIGRAKETIVLLGGENIEPTPIEEKLVQSEFIDQVMVVGQDQKFLAALIIPNKEKVESTAAEREISFSNYELLAKSREVQEIINAEIQSLINSRNGFKTYERIFRFAVLPDPFEIGKEMTQTLKVKRNVVAKTYKKEIKELFV